MEPSSLIIVTMLFAFQTVNWNKKHWREKQRIIGKNGK